LSSSCGERCHKSKPATQQTGPIGRPLGRLVATRSFNLRCFTSFSAGLAKIPSTALPSVFYFAALVPGLFLLRDSRDHQRSSRTTAHLHGFISRASILPHLCHAFRPMGLSTNRIVVLCASYVGLQGSDPSTISLRNEGTTAAGAPVVRTRRCFRARGRQRLLGACSPGNLQTRDSDVLTLSVGVSQISRPAIARLKLEFIWSLSPACGAR